jgi:hypothetical protein
MNDFPRWLPGHDASDLPDLEAWRKNSPSGVLSLIDYFACTSTPDGFFAVLELLYPALIDVDGVRFIASRFKRENYLAWRARNLDSLATQRMMNHLHVRSLFDPEKLTDKTAVAVAQSIAAVWSRVFDADGLVGVASGEEIDTAEVTLVEKPR